MSAPSQPQAHNSWLDAVLVYFQPRVLVVILLGFSAGLPLALSGSTLLIWMTDRGIDLGTVGLYSLVGVPYTLKFLWAPAVDAWQVPFLGRRLGRRRGWLIASQLALMVAIVMLGRLEPEHSLLPIALAALIVAAASATQDIVIDAFRVESLPDNEQAAGLAGYVAAYRIAYLVSTAGVIALAGWLEKLGFEGNTIWFWSYCGAALLLVIGMAAVLFAVEPDGAAPDEETGDDSSFGRLFKTAISAFVDFFTKPQAIVILLFVLLFKFCDAFAGVMTGPFVITLGFDKATYAGIVKGVGTIAVLAGGFAGGFIARAIPMTAALWIAGILQMGSNLVFSWLATVGVDNGALAVAIVVENLSGGIGTVIFVAYLSALCSSPLHTATQFALLTAVASVGRTVLSANAGFIAEATGWYQFFIITAVAAIPGLMLLFWLQTRGHFETMSSRS